MRVLLSIGWYSHLAAPHCQVILLRADHVIQAARLTETRQPRGYLQHPWRDKLRRLETKGDKWTIGAQWYLIVELCTLRQLPLSHRVWRSACRTAPHMFARFQVSLYTCLHVCLVVLFVCLLACFFRWFVFSLPGRRLCAYLLDIAHSPVFLFAILLLVLACMWSCSITPHCIIIMSISCHGSLSFLILNPCMQCHWHIMHWQSLHCNISWKGTVIHPWLGKSIEGQSWQRRMKQIISRSMGCPSHTIQNTWPRLGSRAKTTSPLQGV